MYQERYQVRGNHESIVPMQDSAISPYGVFKIGLPSKPVTLVTLFWSLSDVYAAIMITLANR
jgi:hypothetical protein